VPSVNLNSFVEKKELNISPAFVAAAKNVNGAKRSSKRSKRKYTLEELEVEGFEPSTSESEHQSNIQEEFEEEDEEDDEVDLSSLIEGGVDDDDEAVDQSVGDEVKSRAMASDLAASRRPSRPQLTIVDDVDDEEDEELFGEDQELVRNKFGAVTHVKVLS
jgi:hypothetical protein